MKKAALIALAAVSVLSTAAMAQDVRIGVPGGGPGVTIDNGYGPRDRYRDRDYRRSYNSYDGDSTVVRKKRNSGPNGERVVIERNRY